MCAGLDRVGWVMVHVCVWLGDGVVSLILFPATRIMQSLIVRVHVWGMLGTIGRGMLGTIGCRCLPPCGCGSVLF